MRMESERVPKKINRTPPVTKIVEFGCLRF